MTEPLDLVALLDRHNLRPRRQGGRLRFLCPSHQRDAGRGASLDASADLREEAHPWRCWQCDAKGTIRTLAVMLGEAAPAQWRPEPRRVKPEPPRRAHFDEAWSWLAARAGDSHAAVEAYALRRSWPADIAAVAALVADWLHLPALTERPRAGRAAEIVASVRGAARAHRLLVPLRAPDGRVVSCARRWDLDGPQPAAAKSLRLSADVSESVPLAVYGDLRAGAEALDAGHPCYVVEGAPDWLAVSALLLARGMPGAVVGAYHAGSFASTAEALVALCREPPAHVVLVPDAGKAGDAALADALVRLDRSAGVHVVRTPDDVAAYLAQHGADATMHLLTQPEQAIRRPVSLARSAGAVADALDALADETLNDPVALGVLVVPPGVGKTHAALALAARIATGHRPSRSRRRKPVGDERRVVFALASHDLCDEKQAELALLAPDVPTVHLRGLLAHCRFSVHVERHYAAVGRRGVCGVGRGADPAMRCTYADTCAGAVTPDAVEGAVTLAPHAMAPRLTADLTIIDESPGVVATDSVGALEVATLYDHNLTQAVRNWARAHIDTTIPVTAKFSTMARGLALAHAAACESGAVPPYPRRIWGAELVDALSAIGVTKATLRAAYVDAGPPPMPLPMDVRDGLADERRPSVRAWRAMRAMAEALIDRGGTARDALRDVLDLPQEAPEVLPCLRIDPVGSWAIELRSVAKLPTGAVIVLDATGELTEQEWRAAYPHRRVTIRRVDVAGARARAVHVQTGAFARTQACPRGAVEPGAVARLGALVALAAREVRALHAATDPHVSVGLITHAPLARCDVKAPDATVTAGYFGRDSRGTNRWAETDALVVAGDPVPEIGSTAMDAALLRLTPEALAAGRVAAELAQAVARARHTRRTAGREAVVVYAGRSPPALHGVAWEQRAMPGEQREWSGRITLGDLALHVAAQRGVETTWQDVCEAAPGGAYAALEPSRASRKGAELALDSAAKRLGWMRQGGRIMPRGR